jgi:predicted ATP-grasp superfamily ATP-dependent carboligase
MQYCDILGRPLPTVSPRYDYRWMRAITDLPAGAQETRAGLTTPARYLRSLLGKTTFSVWSWRDPLPALMDASSVAVRAAAGLRKTHAPGLASAVTQPLPLKS